MYIAEWRTEVRNSGMYPHMEKRPWKTSDFIHSEKSQAVDKSGTLFAQAELGLLQNKPDMVPDWAKGPYKRREKVVAIG